MRLADPLATSQRADGPMIPRPRLSSHTQIRFFRSFVPLRSPRLRGVRHRAPMSSPGRRRTPRETTAGQVVVAASSDGARVNAFAGGIDTNIDGPAMEARPSLPISVLHRLARNGAPQPRRSRRRTTARRTGRPPGHGRDAAGSVRARPVRASAHRAEKCNMPTRRPATREGSSALPALTGGRALRSDARRVALSGLGGTDLFLPRRSRQGTARGWR